MYNNQIAKEIAEIDPKYGRLLDEILDLEKKLHKTSNNPGALTIHDFVGGHFTEAVCHLEGTFGPCVESREACFRFLGFYIGKGAFPLPELEATVKRLQSRLVGRAVEEMEAYLASGRTGR